MLAFHKSQNGAFYATDGRFMVVRETERVSVKPHHRGLEKYTYDIAFDNQPQIFSEMVALLASHYESGEEETNG